MKIYTRTGDQGTTSLVGGQRVSKCCSRLESYGTIDELNSHIGLLMTETTDPDDRQLLLSVQGNLFVIGSYLATDTAQTQLRSASIVTDDMLTQLEQAIDTIDAQLPALRSFVLPGGTRGAAIAHVCRTVCRRAERCILTLQQELPSPLDPHVLAYVNRLSDYLFILARKLNIQAAQEEILWQPSKK